MEAISPILHRCHACLVSLSRSTNTWNYPELSNTLESSEYISDGAILEASYHAWLCSMLAVSRHHHNANAAKVTQSGYHALAACIHKVSVLGAY